MATHSSILASRILWREEPGGPAVDGIAQSQTRLKRFSMHACIGKELATHSRVLAWRIPGMGEPVGSHRVRHE